MDLEGQEDVDAVKVVEAAARPGRVRAAAPRRLRLQALDRLDVVLAVLTGQGAPGRRGSAESRSFVATQATLTIPGA